MQPSDACYKIGEPVLDVIQVKYSEARNPLARSIDALTTRYSELVPVNLIEDSVIEVARSLSGESRPGSTDLISL